MTSDPCGSPHDKTRGVIRSKGSPWDTLPRSTAGGLLQGHGPSPALTTPTSAGFWQLAAGLEFIRRIHRTVNGKKFSVYLHLYWTAQHPACVFVSSLPEHQTPLLRHGPDGATACADVLTRDGYRGAEYRGANRKCLAAIRRDQEGGSFVLKSTFPVFSELIPCHGM